MLEIQGWTDKWGCSVRSNTWSQQCWPTGKDVHQVCGDIGAMANMAKSSESVLATWHDDHIHTWKHFLSFVYFLHFFFFCFIRINHVIWGENLEMLIENSPKIRKNGKKAEKREIVEINSSSSNLTIQEEKKKNHIVQKKQSIDTYKTHFQSIKINFSFFLLLLCYICHFLTYHRHCQIPDPHSLCKRWQKKKKW